MIHRKLFLGSIIALAVGIILSFVVGPAIALAGITSHFEGWWIFGQTVYEKTPVYWVGYGLSLTGLVILIGAGFGLVIAIIMEILDRPSKTSTMPTPS